MTPMQRWWRLVAVLASSYVVALTVAVAGRQFEWAVIGAVAAGVLLLPSIWLARPLLPTVRKSKQKQVAVSIMTFLCSVMLLAFTVIYVLPSVSFGELPAWTLALAMAGLVFPSQLYLAWLVYPSTEARNTGLTESIA